jgi:hypothetical protein
VILLLFGTLCYNRSFQDMEYHYGNLLERLHLLTLHNRRRHFDDLFLIKVSSGTTFCPSVLEMVGLRVLTRNISNIPMFTCSSSHCPSARCVSTANTVCKSTDIFKNSCLSIRSLNWFIYLGFYCYFCLFCPVLSYCCCCLYSCWLCNWPLAVELIT